jgi:NADH-quinone oxidoreductase subunit J
MLLMFYLNAAVAMGATAMAVTRSRAVHALLYFVVSLLSVALLFFISGATLAAALELIIFAGAIMVLLLFVIMMTESGVTSTARPEEKPRRSFPAGPAVLAAALLAELVYVLSRSVGPSAGSSVSPASVGAVLFGPYLIGVELAAFLLLAALIGAYHLGRCALSGPGKEAGDDRSAG